MRKFVSVLHIDDNIARVVILITVAIFFSIARVFNGKLAEMYESALNKLTFIR